jgi:alpha-beta hydrolase superfamily lysophospholipase
MVVQGLARSVTDLIETSTRGKVKSAWAEAVYQFLNTVGARLIPSSLPLRAVANGLNKEEIDVVLRQSDSVDELQELFGVVADAYEEKGRYYEELGLKPRVKDHYFHSALWNFYAQLLSCQPEQKADRYKRSAFTYAKAADHFEDATEKISIPYLAHRLAGYLRLPETSKAFDLEQREGESLGFPTVIIVNSFDSTKEELYYTENAFLKAGMATLSFDHLGMGESECDTTTACDVLDLANALELFLAGCPQIDGRRIALHGLSFGGSLALKLAAEFPQRFQAVACLSTPYDLKKAWAEQRLDSQQISDKQNFPELLEALAAPEHISSISSPLLVAGGGRDPLVTVNDLEQIYGQANSQDKKLLLCPKAGHQCLEMMPSLRFEIAQWIRERI